MTSVKPSPPESMVAAGLRWVLALTVIAVALPVWPRATSDPECGRCHVAARPGPGTAELRPCPRPPERAVTAPGDRRRGPLGVIELDMASLAGGAVVEPDLYGPVPFDHGAHAAWAEAGSGCVACHHGTSLGAEQPACSSCHAVTGATDFHRPGLKGAYHRQCLGCHREWDHEVGCSACHRPRDGGGAGPAATAGSDDIIGVAHPPIEPAEVYEVVLDFPTPVGSKVTFHHRRHAEAYALRCVECHRGDSCRGCHGAGGETIDPGALLHFRHDVCGACHEVEDDAGGACAACHRNRLEAPPGAFDHARTGWPLSPEHRRLSCRACHGDAPYGPRLRECSACHDDWVAGTVAHDRIAGITLDGPHGELACADCHAGARFALPATCDGCHGDELPADALPGTRVGVPGGGR